jgi:hypothetical protein
MTASMNAVLAELKIPLRPSLTFRAVNKKYLVNLQKATSQIGRFPRFYLTNPELEYLFHLESELWGSRCGHYLPLIGKSIPRYCVLETYRFTEAFFLLERWLSGFCHVSSRSRRPYRDALFDSNTGIFTKQFRDCLAALGAPYNLLSSPTTVRPILGQSWTSLSSAPVPSGLKAFYRRIGHSHFVSIVESSFKRTTRKMRSSPKMRARARNLEATWYDVLWFYSESMRYRPLSPSRILTSRPFYWNRSVRWCASLLITGLLDLANRSDATGRIPALWRTFQSANPILKCVFRSSRDKIR